MARERAKVTSVASWLRGKSSTLRTAVLDVCASHTAQSRCLSPSIESDASTERDLSRHLRQSLRANREIQVCLHPVPTCLQADQYCSRNTVPHPGSAVGVRFRPEADAAFTTISPSSSGVGEGITPTDALDASKPHLTQVHAGHDQPICTDHIQKR